MSKTCLLLSAHQLADKMCSLQLFQHFKTQMYLFCSLPSVHFEVMPVHYSWSLSFRPEYLGDGQGGWGGHQ